MVKITVITVITVMPFKVGAIVKYSFFNNFRQNFIHFFELLENTLIYENYKIMSKNIY